MPVDFDEVSSKMLEESIFIFLFHSSLLFLCDCFRLGVSAVSCLYACVCLPHHHTHIHTWEIMQILDILNFLFFLISCELSK